MGEFSERGRIGALTRSASEDTRAMTARARSAYRDSFDTGGASCSLCGTHPVIPPDLPEEERRRRGAASYAAHLARVSQRAAAAKRRIRRAADELGAAADEITGLSAGESL